MIHALYAWEQGFLDLDVSDGQILTTTTFRSNLISTISFPERKKSTVWCKVWYSSTLWGSFHELSFLACEVLVERRGQHMGDVTQAGSRVVLLCGPCSILYT